MSVRTWFGISRLGWIGSFLLLSIGCSPTAEKATTGTTTSRPLTQETKNKIERFCSDCHPLPLPETFPKAAWPEEVRQGYDFYVQAKRSDLPEPLRHDTIRYFQELAPDKVIVPRADSLSEPASPVKFELGPSLLTAEESPATAHLVWDKSQRSLYFTDMRVGKLYRWAPGEDWTTKSIRLDHGPIAQGKNTCRVHLCDWNQDGKQDYLQGELGSFPVGDHQNGRVTLALGQDDGSVQTHVLVEGIGRVVQAVPIDYDEDGDLDVLVAEFGWIKTGALRLLRNPGGPIEQAKMKMETIDSRHGVLGVEVADIDNNGKPDFVVAFGQEFESTELYLNQGSGNFERQILHVLPDPSYNSSSFQIVDVDQDGKLDVVHTCGDTMDAYIAKPYHGLRWFRNQGERRWENRELGLLVGALQSTVADFDGDGDMDIAGVGMFPKANQDGPGAYDSVCWWEQQADLTFVRHSIERDHCYHAACVAADIDNDGRVDLVVGEWPNEQDPGALRIYWNRKP